MTRVSRSCARITSTYGLGTTVVCDRPSSPYPQFIYIDHPSGGSYNEPACFSLGQYGLLHNRGVENLNQWGVPLTLSLRCRVLLARQSGQCLYPGTFSQIANRRSYLCAKTPKGVTVIVSYAFISTHIRINFGRRLKIVHFCCTLRRAH